MDELGLATERTALAWQRTALATTAGAGVMARLTFADLGSLALVTLGAALLLSLWILAESRSRYRPHTGLRHRERARGGRTTAALSVAVVLMALTELAALGSG